MLEILRSLRGRGVHTAPAAAASMAVVSSSSAVGGRHLRRLAGTGKLINIHLCPNSIPQQQQNLFQNYLLGPSSVLFGWRLPRCDILVW